MSARQYLTASFSSGGMPYTYHWDGEPPVFAGQKVLVSGKGGKGTRTVTVQEIGVPKPERFETKSIIGPAPQEPAAEGKLL